LIVYLDTSALVKLYVEEPGSPEVASAIERASGAATARISYAEARAAFARLRRERRVTNAELRRLVQELDEDWHAFSVVEITDAVVRRAGSLAERYDLRAYDAIQLAAALDLRRAGVELAFASFDAKLNHAARRSRLRLLPV
jgi:predicted nucleic acid-binding protein